MYKLEFKLNGIDRNDKHKTIENEYTLENIDDKSVTDCQYAFLMYCEEKDINMEEWMELFISLNGKIYKHSEELLKAFDKTRGCFVPFDSIPSII